MKRGAGASVFGYFWGNAKSDWPRAAMEREGGKRQRSFSKTKDQAHGEWARYATALTLALSRAAGEGTEPYGGGAALSSPYDFPSQFHLHPRRRSGLC